LVHTSYHFMNEK